MESKVKAWLKKPYSDNMDVFGWFLFLGMVSIIGATWVHILRMMGD